MIIPASVAGRLFATGATLGPIIDGLHNQVLLEYDTAAVFVQWTDEWSLATSWTVPPLLGIAYVVLGGILPRLVDRGFYAMGVSQLSPEEEPSKTPDPNKLQMRAILAVLSTACILRFSAILVASESLDVGNGNNLLGGFFNTALFETSTPSEQHLVLLATLAVSQWAWLDSSITSLLVGSLAAVGGPLAETPFIVNGFWHYLESTPGTVSIPSDALYNAPFVDGVVLHSLTGPCYFAVTMDAIALGRWFAAWDKDDGTDSSVSSDTIVNDAELVTVSTATTLEEEDTGYNGASTRRR